MHFLVLASLVGFGSSAFAIDLSPAVGDTVCLQRVYTKAHLQKNPLQKLSEVSIQVRKDEYKDGADSSIVQTAIVIGRSVKNNKLYGNTAWHAGNNKYQIDCDGGSFALKPRSADGQEWVNFVVTPGYYFPLYNGVLQPDLEKTGEPGYEVSLQGDDKNNNEWRLEEVPAALCTDKVNQIQDIDGGC